MKTVFATFSLHVAFIFSLQSALALANGLCDDRSKFVDECFRVHGRLFVSNGTPSVRILVVGTERIFGVVNDGDSQELELPPNIAKPLTPSTHITGDFFICPLTKQKPKEMQMVCLKSGENLAIRKIDEKNN